MVPAAGEAIRNRVVPPTTVLRRCLHNRCARHDDLAERPQTLPCTPSAANGPISGVRSCEAPTLLEGVVRPFVATRCLAWTTPVTLLNWPPRTWCTHEGRQAHEAKYARNNEDALATCLSSMLWSYKIFDDTCYRSGRQDARHSGSSMDHGCRFIRVALENTVGPQAFGSRLPCGPESAALRAVVSGALSRTHLQAPIEI